MAKRDQRQPDTHQPGARHQPEDEEDAGDGERGEKRRLESPRQPMVDEKAAERERQHQSVKRWALDVKQPGQDPNHGKLRGEPGEWSNGSHVAGCLLLTSVAMRSREPRLSSLTS